ncbi:unnamed protein product [Pleuronectes platessa]|uniref:Uncharacterized protein n=1 Tax=Pleuronectes platessa TaxID=8262 RepID=A0A9N7UFR3_PLEPL|nr:unnamed protein product [Pleuronectes platessa]
MCSFLSTSINVTPGRHARKWKARNPGLRAPSPLNSLTFHLSTHLLPGHRVSPMLRHRSAGDVGKYARGAFSTNLLDFVASPGGPRQVSGGMSSAHASGRTLGAGASCRSERPRYERGCDRVKRKQGHTRRQMLNAHALAQVLTSNGGPVYRFCEVGRKPGKERKKERKNEGAERNESQSGFISSATTEALTSPDMCFTHACPASPLPRHDGKERDDVPLSKHGNAHPQNPHTNISSGHYMFTRTMADRSDRDAPFSSSQVNSILDGD